MIYLPIYKIKKRKKEEKKAERGNGTAQPALLQLRAPSGQVQMLREQSSLPAGISIAADKDVRGPAHQSQSCGDTRARQGN